MSSDGSRIPRFYRLPLAERRALIASRAGLEASDLALLDEGLDLETADHMIENVVGVHGLPFAVAVNFTIDGRDRLLPMVIEEPSVVAAASNAARLVRAGGGFTTRVDAALMTAQVQLTGVADPDGAAARIVAAREAILAEAATASERLISRGGGPRDVSARVLSRPGQPDGGLLVVHIDVDCRDAMGANLVNSVAEAVAPLLAELAGPPARAGLRILTNLADRRLVHVAARVPVAELGGPEAAAGVVSASRFAELDPYRAATHNKGIMNGVDAVLIATGNDWRGVEAGAHAYAAREGRYAPLAVWRLDGDALAGELTMPMAVGTVGGALRAHPLARLALRLLGATRAAELAAAAGAAGLASNLAALRALAGEGIQRGHMTLHARAVALAAGARGDAIDRVAVEIARCGDVSPERARSVLMRLEEVSK
jgi:hydroxymethylglutaryl-CoA reductase